MNGSPPEMTHSTETAGPDATSAPISAEALHERLLVALEAAVGTPWALDRLESADTSIAVQIAGSDLGVTMFLDQRPPLVEDRVQSAEGHIELTARQVDEFIRGRLKMPLAVHGRSVACRGRLRPFLTVEPVLRGLLATVSGGDAHGTEDTSLVGHEPEASDGPVPGGPLPAGSDVAVVAEPFPVDGAALADNGERYVESVGCLAVETRDVHKHFGTQRVLDGMNIAIPEGALSVVMGPSGTGKSVLIKHIVGLMRPDSGEVIVRGRSLRKLRQAELTELRRDVGVMYQDGALFSSMNVYDNVAFPIRQHSELEEDEVHDLVVEHLTAVGLESSEKLFPSELSGGMKKRVGLARALVLDPYIVLCDEPDSGLDPVRTALLGELLLDRHAALGGTMIVVTHNSALAHLVSDHVSVVWQGGIVEAGPAERVWNSENPFVKQFVDGNIDGPLGMS